MAISRRDFICRHTHLRRTAYVPELQLRLAEEIIPIWRLAERYAGGRDLAPPFWAFAWVGGQALARYLLDHPAEVAGKQVLDFAAGSGIVAIAAMRAGAARALAADIDPFAAEVVAMNAQVNGVNVEVTDRDLLRFPPPAADLVFAGDICYEQPLAARAISWLRAAHVAGSRVLIGDPGRAHLPAGLIRLANYEVPTSRDLEDAHMKSAGIFTFPPCPREPGSNGGRSG